MNKMDSSAFIICAIFFILIVGYSFIFKGKEKKNYAVSVVSAIKDNGKKYPTGSAILRMKFSDTIHETGNETEEVAFIGGEKYSLLVYRNGKLINRISKTNLGGQRTYAALAIDLNNTGLDDLILARDGGVFVYLQKYGGHFDMLQIMPGSKNSIPINLTVSELDEHGDPNFYVSNFVHPKNISGKRFGDSKNKIVSRDPNGSWDDITEKVKTGVSNYAAAFMNVGQENWPDLVMSKSEGELDIYKNNAGTFTEKSNRKISEMDKHGLFGKWNTENDDIDLITETRTSNIILYGNEKFGFVEIISAEPKKEAFGPARNQKMNFGEISTPGSTGAKKANEIQSSNKKLASKGQNEDQLFASTSKEGGLNSRNLGLIGSNNSGAVPIVNDNKSSNNELMLNNKSLHKTSDKPFLPVLHPMSPEDTDKYQNQFQLNSGEVGAAQSYLNNYSGSNIQSAPRNDTSRNLSWYREGMKDKPTSSEVALGQLPVVMNEGNTHLNMNIESRTANKKEESSEIIFINMLHDPILYLNPNKFNEPEVRKYLAASNGYQEYQHNIEEFLNISVPNNAAFFNSSIRVHYTPKNGQTKFQERQSIKNNQNSGYVYHFVLGTKANDVKLEKVEIIKQNGEILSHANPIKNSTLVIKSLYS